MPVAGADKRWQSAGPSRLDSASSIDFRLWASIDHPVSGLAVMVGLLFAIFTVPADVEPRDALRVPALLFIVSLCFFPVLAAMRDPKSIFRAENVLMFAPVYWLLLDPLQGIFDMVGVAREDVIRAFMAIALFVAGAWLAFVQPPWRTPKSIRSASNAELPSQFYFGIGILAFTLGFMRYAVPAGFSLDTMWQSLTAGRWSAVWSRESLGGADAFLDHLSYFGYLLPPLTVLLARRLGWSDRRTFVLGVCSLIMAAFLIQGGGRRLVAVFFGTGAVVWFLGKPKVHLTTILSLALLVLGLLFTLEQMLSYRNGGVLAAVLDEERQAEMETSLVRVDDNFFRLAQTTAIFPEIHPYTTWRYALWVAVRPVPRLFWAGKPVDPGFDLSKYNGLKETSLSSSVVGELFMAGGFIAVALGGWFYGRLARSLSHFLAQAGTSSGLLIYSVGVFALLTGMRSMIELVLTSYVILAWALLVRIYHGFKAT